MEKDISNAAVSYNKTIVIHFLTPTKIEPSPLTLFDKLKSSFPSLRAIYFINFSSFSRSLPCLLALQTCLEYCHNY